jgi:hypothetical protein
MRSPTLSPRRCVAAGRILAVQSGDAGWRYNRIVIEKRLIQCFALAVMFLALPNDARMQAPRQRIDVSKLGPQVGQQVPDFSLRDQNGRTQTLKSIMGPRGAMLVFLRSADW